MALSPCFRIPRVIALSGAPTVSVAQALPAGPDIGARGAWLLRGTSRALVDVLNQNRLTPRTGTPTWNVDSVTLGGTDRKGLYTPWTDSTVGTQAVVFKRPPNTDPTVLNGTMSNADDGGHELIFNGGTFYVNTRGISLVGVTPPMAVGEWGFAAVSHGGPDGRIMLLGGVPAHVDPGTKTASTRLGGFGNTAKNVGSYVASGCQLALAYDFAEALTEDDLNALYAGAKAWLASIPDPIAIY